MSEGLTVVDVVLGLGVLAAAGCALLPRTRFALATGFLVLGVLVSLVWLRLGSVDVALAEAALGGGVLGAVLVWLAVRSRPRPASDAAEARGRAGPRLRAGLGVAAAVVLSVLGALVWLRVSPQVAQWQAPLTTAMPETGVDHGVTAVLLAFRAYDTLLETAVLLMAGVAVMAVGRDGGLHQARIPVRPISETVVSMTRFGAPVLLLVGLWLLFAGSGDSGGAFQAGSVLCAVLIMLRVSGVPVGETTVRWMRPALAVGVVVFVLAGAVGPMLGQPWLTWDPQWAGTAILVVEVFLTVGITAGLYMIYLGLDNPQGAR